MKKPYVYKSWNGLWKACDYMVTFLEFDGIRSIKEQDRIAPIFDNLVLQLDKFDDVSRSQSHSIKMVRSRLDIAWKKAVGIDPKSKDAYAK